MKKRLVILAIALTSLNARAMTNEQCAAYGDKFAEYARDRDAGMTMAAATKKAKERATREKSGEIEEMMVAGVYLNGEMVRMTPNEIRALAVKSCLKQ